MKTFQNILCATACGLIMTSAQAQFTANYKRTGDNFYAKGDYYSAAQYYQKFIDGKTPAQTYDPYVVQKQGTSQPKDDKKRKAGTELLFRLAESYYKLNDFQHAEPWYSELMKAGPAAFPEARYHYAVSLRATGKYAEAESEFTKFIGEYKGDPILLKQATQELANCTFIRKQLALNTSNTAVLKMDSGINKEGASYAAAWAADKSIYFTSTRFDSAASDNDAHANTIYVASYENGVTVAPKKVEIPGLKNTQNGIVAFTPAGNKMFFTGWEKIKDGKKVAAIYSCEKTATGWSKPSLVGNTVNADGSNAAMPAVTADGAYLLFVSDRTGGQGGYDVWYAPLDNKGVPGTAKNAGKKINTAEDEQAPFYHAASKTLVFASKGRTGMGGFDLYTSAGDFASGWSEAVNMGAPVNSIKDDIYFTTQGKRLLEGALVSSDRSSLCCLELFAVNKTYKQYLNGQVIDCETKAPLAGVTVSATDATGVVANELTDASGHYLLEMPAGSMVTINGNKTQYEKAVLAVTPGADTLYNPVLCLVPVKVVVAPPAILAMTSEHILFAYNESKPLAESNQYLDSVVSYLNANPEIRLAVKAYTDSNGTDEFNLKLSEARAQACVKYLVKAGIDKKRLEPKGYGKCCPLEAEVGADGQKNEAAGQKNRRVEFEILTPVINQ